MPGSSQTPPQIAVGSFVSWSGGSGRVDLIVTNGAVPSVPGDEVTGTADSPAARVVVYAKDGDGWKATRRKAAYKVAVLKRIPPLRSGAMAAKTAGADTGTVLVSMLADYETRAEAAGMDRAVTGRAVKAVFDRGVSSWPGEAVTSLTADEWGLGRVEAFLSVALDEGCPDGYRRDADLLA